MARVTGFGGVFLRANDPAALYAWYEQQLGIRHVHGCFSFARAEQRADITVAFFPREAGYFPAQQAAMLNLQVDDLDAVLERLSSAGVAIAPERESYPYGRFGWFTDPEGNRVELWEPAGE